MFEVSMGGGEDVCLQDVKPVNNKINNKRFRKAGNLLFIVEKIC
jgi:hypothetical protein